MWARIVLAADAQPEATNSAIAARLGISRQSVITWRQRFLAHRLEGLVDVPRNGAPQQVDDEAVDRMIALTLEEQPAGVTHWSTRAMARRVGMRQTMISRVWRAFGLQPHRSETSKLSWDPAFVDRVRDVVVAHNAAFDRRFAERFCAVFASKPWARSLSGVGWAGEGFEGTRLGYLAMRHGLSFDGHRAHHDCQATLEILAGPLPKSGVTALAQRLKARGYR